MNNRMIHVLIIVASLAGLVAPGSVQARMKCWTNNEGIKECGDKVPPEYAQKGHQKLDKRGLVREETERAKTEEEIAAEKRLAKLEAEKKKKEEAQKNRDHILLQTFSSVEDIERARDERVAALESTINLTQARNDKIQLDLDKRINAAALQERNGKTPAEALLNDIESLKRQISNNNTFIDEKRAEQESIKQAHALDIERFKKLKGIN